MAKSNGRQLSVADVAKMDEIATNVANDSKRDENLNPLHMFRSPVLPKVTNIGLQIYLANFVKIIIHNNTRFDEIDTICKPLFSFKLILIFNCLSVTT
jgi:hypothetical protein